MRRSPSSNRRVSLLSFAALDLLEHGARCRSDARRGTSCAAPARALFRENEVLKQPSMAGPKKSHASLAARTVFEKIRAPRSGASVFGGDFGGEGCDAS